ncbi:hypothetical protein DUNSADRAFT_10403 [Dunaliella salina]|uniref:Uncharacterized protein n=1 Tax=Dunaliella salina TaxID=3046 RepID=A0ABQ7GFD9_DUNSA|nr:hypothetical protein DUNSADRAFT_10403 [Dunaliella salina]|eukprot:KAF5833323.1 hypothetical protein DUNSADRAFT_10403 [Dunaliella salina]
MFDTPWVWMQVAKQAAKRILLVYDPTPGLNHTVDLVDLLRHAPTELQAAFSSHLQREYPDPKETGVDVHVFPFPIGDANANLQDCTHAILEVVKD